MVRPSKSNKSDRELRAPATTPEAAERRLVGMAYDLAEKQLNDGTASSQVITHFLKIGSTREKVELEKLRQETKLRENQAQAVMDAKRQEELVQSAINAFRSYATGVEHEEEPFDL